MKIKGSSDDIYELISGLIIYKMLHKLINAYDSEQDENYEPTAKEKREYQIEHIKKKKAKR